MDEKLENVQEVDVMATGNEVNTATSAENQEIRYKKVDSETGYLTNQVEIGNLKVYQRRDVVANLMLGDYNEKGDYVVKPDILKSLVALKKEKTGDYNQIIFLNSIEGFGDKGKLKFSLSVNRAKNAEGYNVAVLKLLEPVKKIGGYIENTNTFVVASYRDKADETFNSKIRKIFNILDDGEDGGKAEDEVVASILARLKRLQQYDDYYEDDILNQEQAYYYARLELLKDARFEEVLNEYRKHLTKASMFIDPASSYYYAYLNELLDLAVDVVSNRNAELGELISQTVMNITQKHTEICEARHTEILNKIESLEQNIAQVIANENTASMASNQKPRAKTNSFKPQNNQPYKPDWSMPKGGFTNKKSASDTYKVDNTQYKFTQRNNIPSSATPEEGKNDNGENIEIYDEYESNDNYRVDKSNNFGAKNTESNNFGDNKFQGDDGMSR